MLYYLFEYLDKHYDLAGAGLFQYISFRAFLAVIVSLIIGAVFGNKLINFLRKQQIGETIRDLGLQGQMEKKGTPTMGGLIIIGSILVPVLLFAKITNIYIVILVVTVIWLGFIGFLDDYIKVFKKNKEGLAGRFKIAGQIIIGVFVGLSLYFSKHVLVREVLPASKQKMEVVDGVPTAKTYVDVKSTATTIPFVKHNEFDYKHLVDWVGLEDYLWIVYTIIVIFIITSVSNGANITDGIDGLAAGTSAIIGIVIAIFAYVSGNTIFSEYLNIMYIPHTGELVVFCAAFVGACVGFLWYNTFPAQVFMGDTGSLMLGGTIATLCLCVRKELLIPLLCGIFLIENLSVVMQVSYFKYTKKKYGEGRRIFKMSPLHHHYQKSGYAEPKIVTRFWIIGIILAIVTLLTLKIR